VQCTAGSRSLTRAARTATALPPHHHLDLQPCGAGLQEMWPVSVVRNVHPSGRLGQREFDVSLRARLRRTSVDDSGEHLQSENCAGTASVTMSSLRQDANIVQGSLRRASDPLDQLRRDLVTWIGRGPSLEKLPQDPALARVRAPRHYPFAPLTA
jgi:hypothetical protein